MGALVMHCSYPVRQHIRSDSVLARRVGKQGGFEMRSRDPCGVSDSIGIGTPAVAHESQAASMRCCGAARRSTRRMGAWEDVRR